MAPDDLFTHACLQIENSLYEIKMNVEEYCKVLCTKQYSGNDLKEFKSKVHADVQLNPASAHRGSVVCNGGKLHLSAAQRSCDCL